MRATSLTCTPAWMHACKLPLTNSTSWKYIWNTPPAHCTPLFHTLHLDTHIHMHPEATCAHHTYTTTHTHTHTCTHPDPHIHSHTHPYPQTDYTCLERQLVDIGWFHIYKQTKCCTCTNTPQLAYTRAWHLRPTWPKQTKQEAPCVNQHTQKPYKYIRKWILSPPGQNVLLCRLRHRLYKKQLHWTNGRI